MDIDQEDYYSRELFAHFGLAMYHTQVLEHAIVNLIAFASLIPTITKQDLTKFEWHNLIDEFYSTNFKKTLGQLIKALKSYGINLPDNLASILEDSLEKRNYLAHHFFREEIQSCFTLEGNITLITKLQEYQQVFINTDRLIDKIILPFANKYGITEQIIQQELDLIKNADSGHS